MNNFTIMHHNIRGLNHKLTELKLIISTYEPDVITINESYRIKENTKIPNYTITQPHHNTGKGVAIIHKNQLTVDILPQIETKIPHTNLHFAIMVTTPTDSIQIATIYCPRKFASNEIINAIAARHDNTIITGDFNSRHPDLGHEESDASGRRLIEIMDRHNYTKLNDNEPTYTNDTTGRQDVKDIIFTSPRISETFQDFWVDDDLGSDHNTIFASFTHQGVAHKIAPKYVLLHHKADWQLINNNITQEMDTLKLNNKSTQHDIDTYITHLTSTINENIENHVKKIKIEPQKIGLPPFIRDLIKDKRKIRKKYQKSRKQEHKTEYNKLNKQIKTLIKEYKQDNWANKCNDLELKDNQNTTWKQIKQMTGQQKPKTKFPTLITQDKNGQTIKSTTTQDKVKIITETFEDIFTYDNPKPYFDDTHKINVTNHMKEIQHQLSPLKSIPENYLHSQHKITINEISKEIDKLDSKKAPGPDTISNTTIKYLKPSLVNILYILYNLSFQKGYHSINWKTPLVILFNKPGKSSSNPLNLRAISLINTLSKILEKIITRKLTLWAESNNKINPEQAGFRAHKSTQDKIFQLTQTAMHAKNMGRRTAAIFMDVEKAFDKVWHAGLIDTLINIDLPLLYIRYINSFLSDRHMFFRIHGLESPKIKLNFGVPQGSSLSPILFNLYVADIPTPTAPNTFLSQFADDIKLYSTSAHMTVIQKRLQLSLNKILSYCGTKRISINENKTFELVFIKKSRKSQTEEEISPVTCHGSPIPIKSSGKFLGILFDEKLSFQQHIASTVSRAKYRSNCILTLHNPQYGPSNPTMIRLFNIFIRPLLEYGHTALITAHPRLITQLESVQTTFIRRILHLPRIHNNTTRKLANVNTIKNRLLNLSDKWLKNTSNNIPIQNFINTRVSKVSRLKTPYTIIKNLHTT